MSVRETPQIAPAEGKLGVLLPGLGAVATTLIAGVELIKQGKSSPIGSLTQMAHIRLGKRTDNNNPAIKDFVPLASLDDLVFAGWDIYEDNCYESASNAAVLDPTLMDQVKPQLEKIKPMTAVFEKRFAKRIDGPNVKTGPTKMDLANQLMADIEQFKKDTGVSRCVMVWCASTEIFMKPSPTQATLAAFEKGLEENCPSIAPSQIYAYAAIKSGVPFANGAPNLTVDVEAIQELAKKHGVPISGKDYKSGQTFMKTLIAPGLKSRMLGVSGWFSGHILGNRDGEVLDEPENFKTKEDSKLSALNVIFQPEHYPELYGNYYHKVRIEYYPPRGDNKEGWDNIDIFGWLGYPMQLKINFLCRDSILAAPLALDLALFMDLAQRTGMSGIQEWLSFYFKAPIHADSVYPEHDLFIQLMKLKNTLRHMQGEELITHLGNEYYD
jgi:myo-inositol-1-phosphate synthase